MNTLAPPPARHPVIPSILRLAEDYRPTETPKPRRTEAPAPPDRTAGLTASNSVTISASAILDLPPGRYHWSLFDGLDIHATSAAASIAARDQRIVKLESDYESERKRNEIISEQCYFARELLDNIEAHLGGLNAERKLTDKALREFRSLVENSMFER